LPPGMNATDIARKAAQRNIEVVPLGNVNGDRASRQGLQLGFAAVDTKEIRRGLTELSKVLTSGR
jgi:DNA-binding transcriptional MocR family regulator